MPKNIDTDLLAVVQDTFDKASAKADEYSGVLGSIKGTIVHHFGQNGLIAAYVVLAVVVLVIITRLTKITFSTIKYLVIPAVALAFVGAYFLPYSFAALLPVTVTISSLVLLFKG